MRSRLGLVALPLLLSLSLLAAPGSASAAHDEAEGAPEARPTTEVRPVARTAPGWPGARASSTPTRASGASTPSTAPRRG